MSEIGTPEWAILLNGASAVDADSFADLDYKVDETLSDYPVEQGGFESYDKVQLPFDVRVRLTMSRTEADRRTFLTTLEAIRKDMNRYDVVTPEATYSSVNFVSLGYRRTSENGAGMIVAELRGYEVRVSATATFSNTQSASGADSKQQGTVQTKPPTPPQSTLPGGFAGGGGFSGGGGGGGGGGGYGNGNNGIPNAGGW